MRNTLIYGYSYIYLHYQYKMKKGMLPHPYNTGKGDVYMGKTDKGQKTSSLGEGMVLQGMVSLKPNRSARK